MNSLGDLSESHPEVEQRDHEASTSYPPCASPHVAPTVRQRNFVTQTHDAALHFQILDLGRQYYVWVSAVGPKLGNLHLAIKTPADKAPAVASLLPGGGTAGEGPAMAQRLALKLSKPVICSCNMPPNAPLLQAVAERRLLEELKAMEAEGRGQGQGVEVREQGPGEGTEAQGQERAQGAGSDAGSAGGVGENGTAAQDRDQQAASPATGSTTVQGTWIEATAAAH